MGGSDVAPAIEVRDLTKRYGARRALAGISCQIPQGVILGLLGSNGAGKSTFLRTVLGLTRPTAGQIFIHGRPLWPEPPRVLSHVGGFVDRPRFYPFLTARENLTFLAEISGQPRHRVDEVLAYVDLISRADDRVAWLSHGMQQRLGIAGALLKHPRILVLDEPADGLDPARLYDMRRLLVKIRQDYRATLIVSSHLLTDIERISDLVAVMHEGQWIYLGPPGELGQTPTLEILWDVSSASLAVDALRQMGVDAKARGDREVIAAIDGSIDLGVLNDSLIRCGLSVRTVAPRTVSLEERLLRYLQGGHHADIG